MGGPVPGVVDSGPWAVGGPIPGVVGSGTWAVSGPVPGARASGSWTVGGQVPRAGVGSCPGSIAIISLMESRIIACISFLICC